jgi:hypothetical protein
MAHILQTRLAGYNCQDGYEQQAPQRKQHGASRANNPTPADVDIEIIEIIDLLYLPIFN